MMAYAALLAFAQASIPAVDPLVVRVGNEYAACIQSKMIELGPSNADIEDIFQAAELQCADSWNSAFLVFEEYFEKRGPSPSGSSPQGIAIELLNDLAENAKDRARVAVLRERAGLPPIDVDTL